MVFVGTATISGITWCLLRMRIIFCYSTEPHYCQNVSNPRFTYAFVIELLGRDWINVLLRAGRSGYRIPVRARFTAPVQTGSGAHPSSCTIGTGSFPG